MKKILLSLALMAAVVACEPAPREIQRGVSPQSGALAVTRDDDRLLVAAEDHDQLLIVERLSKKVLHRVAVGQGPVHVIELADGSAAVTNRYGHSVTVVDVDSGRTLKTIAVGAEPYGLVEVSPGLVAVALSGESALALVDIARGAVDRKVTLVDVDPRAVALLKDGSLYVSHMASGKFSRVDLQDDTVTAVDITTRNDFGPRLQAEHLRSLTVAEDGAVIVAHTQANSDTVRAPIDDPNVENPGQGNCGYGGCATELGAVEPGVTVIDPETDVVVVPQQASVSREGEMAADCFDCGGAFPGQFVPNPPSVLNPSETRFGGLQIQNPTAVALFDGGAGQIVVNLGSKNALLMRRELKGTASDVLGVVKLGNGASAIAMSQDGRFAYVWNQFDASISEIEVPSVAADAAAQTRFVPNASGEAVASAELGLVPELAAETVSLVEDALPADVSFGRKLFHDATNAQMAKNGTVSCASCHPDGRTDGRTWQFVFGPRNTPQLGGGILDTAPFHWPGDVATVPALNDMTVLPFMGGSGLPAESFELVAAFIDSIKAAPAPSVTQAALTAAQLRGKAIFESAETACTSCHGGAHFTDNESWDIGTKANDFDITTFQTPVLHGLARSGPYLHDGSAKSLRDLVQQVVVNDRMGKGSHLTTSEIDDLVAYLETL